MGESSIANSPAVKEHERKWFTQRDYSKEEMPLSAEVAPQHIDADDLEWNDKLILMGFTVYFVNDVDALKQQFSCDFRLHLKWSDPAYDDYTGEWGKDEEFVEHQEGKQMVWGPKPAESVLKLGETLGSNSLKEEKDKLNAKLAVRTMPNVNLANAVEATCIEQRVKPKKISAKGRAKSNRTLFTWEQRFRGTFTEALELHNFPFDVQNLSVTIRMNSSADKRTFAQVPLLLQIATICCHHASGVVQLTTSRSSPPFTRVHCSCRSRTRAPRRCLSTAGRIPSSRSPS
jgi:hypothetical protein